MNKSTILRKVRKLYRWLDIYVPLTIHMAQSGVKKDAAGTWGSYLWWLLIPLYYCGLYYFVFAVLLEKRSEYFAAFLLLGMTIWHWFTWSIKKCSRAVEKNANLTRQVDIPKIIFPVQSFMTETYKFLVAIVLVRVLLTLVGTPGLKTLYFFPVVFGVACVLFLGMILVFSALMPFFPDLRNILRFTFRGMLWVSGVVFDSSHIPAHLLPYYKLNPLALIVEEFRKVLLYNQFPSFEALTYVLSIGSVLCAIGGYLHWRYNRVMPRYLT